MGAMPNLPPDFNMDVNMPFHPPTDMNLPGMPFQQPPTGQMPFPTPPSDMSNVPQPTQDFNTELPLSQGPFVPYDVGGSELSDLNESTTITLPTPPEAFSISSSEVRVIASFGGKMFAGTQQGLFVSNDGVDWQNVEGDLGSSSIQAMIALQDILFVATPMALYYSTDGQSWKQVTSINKQTLAGTTEQYLPANVKWFKTSAAGNTYALEESAIYHVKDSNLWQELVQPFMLFSIKDVEPFNSKLFVVAQDNLFEIDHQGMPLSVTVSDTVWTVYAIGSVNNVLVVSTNDGLWYTRNASIWNKVSNSESFGVFTRMELLNNTLYGFNSDGLYASSDGMQWQQLADKNALQNIVPQYMYLYNNTYYLGGRLGIIRSSDTVNWTR